ncbi:MAG: gliding motility-associated C-terminal domain-containing protein [Bacteroidales bacterium]|nr:gliding motility-associated C-terminal domain-containing protein [Bacteroidales bacterium]
MRFFAWIFLMSCAIFLCAQGLINNGAGIIIKSGAHVVVNGHYTNKTGGQDGFVNLDGRLVIKNDLINLSSNEVFTNIGPVYDGWLVMKSPGLQSFKGVNDVRVENLELSGGVKQIDISKLKVVSKLKLSAVLDLHTNQLHLENDSVDAILYQGGYIKAETTPIEGLGFVRWDIGNQTGVYAIPFGSGIYNYSDLLLKLTLAGNGDQSGYFLFSTYGTAQNNLPYPNQVTTLDPYEPDEVLNRYWIIQPVYQNFPTGKIMFSYNKVDANGTNENGLLPINFSFADSKWITFDVALRDVNNHVVETQELDFSKVYVPWSLAGEKEETSIFIPNSFSPNGDGVNDIFAPVMVGNFRDVQMYIFDRWGQMIFYSNDVSQGWDGTFRGEKVMEDVYVLKIQYRDPSGNTKMIIEKIILIR